MPAVLLDETSFLGTSGAELRRARLARGLSREDLAELCGLHPNTIGIAERGDRDLGCLAQTRIFLSLGCVSLHVCPDGTFPDLATAEGSGLCSFLRQLPYPMIARLIGEAIRGRRETLGLSLDETAALAGLHRNTVWNIERGLVVASSMSLYRIYLSLGVSDLLPTSNDLHLR